MRNKGVYLIFLFVCSFCFSQQNVTWQDLSKIKFTDTYFSEYDDYFMYPTFSTSIKALEGKQITIKGYFLDVVAKENIYMLSKGPMASCYFCGQGGPESAIELVFINKQNFKTDDIVSITGTLKLNQDDVEHFNYILTDCKGILHE
ncbi:hypothetical protein PI23P_10105 [Polaribacter irgensii 23-P]|uniref:DUF3299 domain-containing protein n=1 Tax=Polaribacter irgensii 23-P TaxID=313594 RepID=A4C0N0_9FLAO|nr:hypothetical protein [Polaribacter irgensii]EAR12973.1 hypothetical protein PI23P_10105 [Polaribacter irgensii 23-P]